MIFVTVGAQMPFDRLVGAVDAWASAHNRGDIFAQTGETECTFPALESSALLEPDAFRAKVDAADLIVAHAGMGSILTAMSAGKPILVMPRRAANRETRNDHQVATAERFRGRPGVHVAMDEQELATMLDRAGELAAAEPIRPEASPELLAALRSFIFRSV